MINIECENCGCVLKITSAHTLNRVGFICAYCPDCYDDSIAVKNELNEMIDGYDNLTDIIEQQEARIAELEEFIDSYIDGR